MSKVVLDCSPENTRTLQRRRADSFARLGDLIDTRLGNEVKTTYLGVDTVFSLPPGSTFVWDWIRCRSDNVSTQTLRISRESDPHRVHRIMLIQRPEEIPERWARAKFRAEVALMAHLHCWDGALLYVVFISMKQHKLRHIQEFFNFACLLNASRRHGQQLVRLSNLWTKQFDAAEEFTNVEARSYLSKVWQMLDHEERHSAIPLWYEPSYFAATRPPPDRLWGRVLEFVYRLYGGTCQAPECSKRTARNGGHVDHISPVSVAKSVFLNLRWLCDKCNLAKGSKDTCEVPFARIRNHVPPDISTKNLDAVLSPDPPPWLGRFRLRPQSGIWKVGTR